MDIALMIVRDLIPSVTKWPILTLRPRKFAPIQAQSVRI